MMVQFFLMSNSEAGVKGITVFTPSWGEEGTQKKNYLRNFILLLIILPRRDLLISKSESFLISTFDALCKRVYLKGF